MYHKQSITEFKLLRSHRAMLSIRNMIQQFSTKPQEKSTVLKNIDIRLRRVDWRQQALGCFVVFLVASLSGVSIASIVPMGMSFLFWIAAGVIALSALMLVGGFLCLALAAKFN